MKLKEKFISKGFPATPTDPVDLKRDINKKFSPDTSPIRNLGTYSTPVMEQDALEFMNRYIDKNLVDSKSYRSLVPLKKELIGMVSQLVNLDTPYGDVTSGSSESIFLFLLAHKFRWVEKHIRPGKKLNMIVGYNAHNCFNK